MVPGGFAAAKHAYARVLGARFVPFSGAPRRALPCANNRTPKIIINAQQGGTAGSSGRSRGPPSAFGAMRDTTSFFGGSAKHDDLGKVLFAVTPVLQKGDDLCDS